MTLQDHIQKQTTTELRRMQKRLARPSHGNPDLELIHQLVIKELKKRGGR
jgi:hypothetical protein